MIKVSNLVKSYGSHRVLNGLSARSEPGQLVSIIGPSGSGKSTLLKCISGLEIPDSGSIETPSNPGMVFQHFNLFPHLTVLENLTLAQTVVKHLPKDVARDKAISLLKKVDLFSKSEAYPESLSGGQSQRAAIARALCLDPQVILYDEPTSALDPDLTEEVFQVMKDLRSDGVTQWVVTHEMKFVRDVVDEILFLFEGKVAESGKREQVIRSPQDLRTKNYLGKFL